MNPSIFSKQCAKEYQLFKQYEHTLLLCARETDESVIRQLLENFSSLHYREWKENFDQIDSKDSAGWRKSNV